MPTSIDEVRRVVAASAKVRALGTRHSFNAIADTAGVLVSLEQLPCPIELDPERGRVTLGAATRDGELAPVLERAGLALANLGSLPHISVAGACATGTHGSGDHVGNLATAVSAIELVTANGDLLNLAREPDADRFAGSVLALGCLGVVTRISLDVEPSYCMRQVVYEAAERARLPEEIDALLAGGYSVSIFTDWHTPRGASIWFKLREDGTSEDGTSEDGTSADGTSAAALESLARLGATPASAPRHPVVGMDPTSCTEQLGVRGPWYERLPHFRLEHTPSAGEELQSEYLVSRGDARVAAAALEEVGGSLAPVLLVAEIRSVASDRLWMSPSHERDSVAFHFTWIDDPVAVERAVKIVEEVLSGFSARPHWGKLFSISPEVVQRSYSRLSDFGILVNELDPGAKFSNELVERYLPTR